MCRRDCFELMDESPICGRDVEVAPYLSSSEIELFCAKIPKSLSNSGGTICHDTETCRGFADRNQKTVKIDLTLRSIEL